MSLASQYGLELDLKKMPTSRLRRNDFVLFAESNSRFLAEVPENMKECFENLMKGRTCSEIGKVTDNQRVTIRGLDDKIAVDASAADLRHKWQETLGSGDNI
jgi:phosphoribosylformylglycinamidine synthase